MHRLKLLSDLEGTSEDSKQELGKFIELLKQ